MTGGWHNRLYKLQGIDGEHTRPVRRLPERLAEHVFQRDAGKLHAKIRLGECGPENQRASAPFKRQPEVSSGCCPGMTSKPRHPAL